MSVPLNPICKTVIANLNLAPHNQKIIERCISRYSTPCSFCQSLSYVVHRIKNTIKSIFKLSDWQLAEKVVVNYLKAKVNFEEKIEEILAGYPHVLKSKVNYLLKKTIDTVIIYRTKILLKTVVQVNCSTSSLQAKSYILRTKNRLNKKKVVWEKTFHDKLENLIKELPQQYSALILKKLQNLVFGKDKAPVIKRS